MTDTGYQNSDRVETARRRLEEKMEGMSFLAHLEELRVRIIRCIIAVAVGFGFGFWKADAIFGWVQQPLIDALQKNHLTGSLVYLNPAEPFNMYLKIGVVAGLFLTSPYILYQVWGFIAPGLYRHEKKYIVPFLVSTVFLFCAGGYCGYRIVYPRALNFLIGFSHRVTPMITISEYTELFLIITVGMGLIFEMPILAGFLGAMGVVKPGFLIKHFRYAILAIFIIAAIVTPTPDVMSMCIFAAPMVVLYGVSIGVVWFVHPKRRKDKEAKLQA
jgi:sec-independent protein translocase protein TatC